MFDLLFASQKRPQTLEEYVREYLACPRRGNYGEPILWPEELARLFRVCEEEIIETVYDICSDNYDVWAITDEGSGKLCIHLIPKEDEDGLLS